MGKRFQSDGPREDDPVALSRRVVILENKVKREKEARIQAERTLEERGTALFEANREIVASNERLEEANANLQATMTNLTDAEVRRKATLITLLVAVVLFLVSEFAIEPIIERNVGRGFPLVFSKILILGFLIPVEMVTSRILSAQVRQATDLIKARYLKLLEAAYDDGIITDLERTLLNSSREQFGLTKVEADLIEADFLERLAPHHAP